MRACDKSGIGTFDLTLYDGEIELLTQKASHSCKDDLFDCCTHH